MAKRTRESLDRRRRRKAARARTKTRDRSPSIRRSGETGQKLIVALAVLGVSAAVVLPFVYVGTGFLPELRTALGMTGAPGTATVLSCTPYRNGRTTYQDCDARFVFDDPARAPIVIQTVSEVREGATFRAAIDPRGERAVPTDARGVWRAIGLLGMFLLVPAVLLYCFSFIPAAGTLQIGLRVATGALMAITVSATAGGFVFGY